MIVVVSHPEDPHAQRVIERLEAGKHEVFLLDISELPGRATLTIDYDDPRRPRIAYQTEAGRDLDLGRATSVWWRRPQVPDASGIFDPNVRYFTASEWNEAINGLWQLIDVPWMNPPRRDEVAARKAYQLRIAAEVGLAVPHTLITSDPQRARDFIAAREPDKTVFKTFAATHAIWRETRLVGADDLALLEAVRLAPVIFQEYIPAGVDLRVTVVGRSIFAAAIDSRATDYPIDFRMSLGQAAVEAVELPRAVATSLHRLMERLGLAYGAIDMRRAPDGRYVFFEINTAGEFLFIEERTGQPITAAVADWLARPS